MQKCASCNRILVLPHRPEYGMTNGRYVKKDHKIVGQRPRRLVLFNPDFKQLFGDGWMFLQGNLDDEVFRLVNDNGEVAQVFTVGCGKCLVCRQNHAFQWKMRLLMERELYERDDDCCFLTLDYNELFVPRDDNGLPTLCHDDISTFIRNVRDAIQAKNPDARLRYFCAGEYGDSTERPHYHLILFGYDFFKDARYVRKSRGGFSLYSNPILDKAWSKDGVPKGGAFFGMFSAGTAMYTAQYCVKKLLSGFDPMSRRPPYIQMSRKPGIGHDYIILHADEILEEGGVYLSGQFFPINRYMLKVLSPDFDKLHECVQNGHVLTPLERVNSHRFQMVDFERRRLLSERAERVDVQQQALTDLPLWKSRQIANDVAFSRSKVHAKLKGGL